MLRRLMMKTDTSRHRYLLEGKISKIYPVTLESISKIFGKEKDTGIGTRGTE